MKDLVIGVTKHPVYGLFAGVGFQRNDEAVQERTLTFLRFDLGVKTTIPASVLEDVK